MAKQYCKDWEKEPDLNNLISSVADDDGKAACKVSKFTMRAHLSNLTAHV